MAEVPHRKLAKCHVLFLGDSTPEETKSGLKALQQPLMKCYPVDNPTQVEGIDSWITIFTSGILLQYVGNSSKQPPPIWFPIQNLYVAAATKCINYLDGHTGRRIDTEFVDINHSSAEHSSHPPLFSIIVRKSYGTRVLRCYTFLVRDERPAVAMVDAAKHAFTNESGWSDGHPPQDVIKSELVQPVIDPDAEIDEFDSVSAAGRRANQNGATNGIPSPNQSQDISDSEIPSVSTANDANKNSSRTFPQNLVKKYTLTNTKRQAAGGTGVGSGGASPRRGQLPEEFLPRGGYAGMRVGPPPQFPPHMMPGGSMRVPGSVAGSVAGSMAGSMRSTSTVRVVRDPRTRTSMIERVIREPVPVPVPVYQPPPPPKIIHEVQPIYIPQPPEIRHVEREVPVPVEIPVPYYPVPGPEDYGRHSHSKHSRKHHHKSSSHKHNTFKNYQIYDERFTRPAAAGDRPGSFFDAQRFEGVPRGNGYYNPPGEHYHARPSHHHRSSKRGSPEGRRERERSDSSDRSSSSERGGKYKHAWQELDPYKQRMSNGGVEITEIPDDRRRSKKDRRSKEADINGNHQKHGEYHIRELEKDTSRLDVNDGAPRRVQADVHGGDFKWSHAAASPEGRRKSERRTSRRSPSPDRRAERSPPRNGGMTGPSLSVPGGQVIGGRVYDLPPGSDMRRQSSFQAYRQDDGDRHESKKDKKKDKRKRDKTPNKYDAAMRSGFVKPGGKEYYFKEQTEGPPRNWMDEDKEYMNERAFSSSLANQTNDDLTNAYALNKAGDDMFDRSMPAPPPPDGIPPPPPLPSDLMAEIQARGNNADLY